MSETFSFQIWCHCYFLLGSKAEMWAIVTKKFWTSNTHPTPCSLSYFLHDIVPPAIRGNKEEAEKLMALVDTSINIECRATGIPPPQINWLKNGLPLPLSSHIRLLSGGQVIRSAFIVCDLQDKVTVIVGFDSIWVNFKHHLFKNGFLEFLLLFIFLFPFQDLFRRKSIDIKLKCFLFLFKCSYFSEFV